MRIQAASAWPWWGKAADGRRGRLPSRILALCGRPSGARSESGFGVGGGRRRLLDFLPTASTTRWYYLSVRIISCILLRAAPLSVATSAWRS